jgi:hypothetical protein
MPEGQFSGSRASYEYTSDNGTVYLLTLDETLGGLTETGLVAATQGTTGIEPPKRFNPRVVFWQGELSGRQVRKQLVCNSNGSAYVDTSTAITVDGVDGITTGRRGEKLTFTRLPAP